MQPLKIIKKLQNLSVLKGSNIVFDIETNQKPKTVKWYKNDIEIISNTFKNVLKQITNTKYQLEILDANFDDNANFKVNFYLKIKIFN